MINIFGECNVSYREHTLTKLHLWFFQEHTQKGKGRRKGVSKTEIVGDRQHKDSDNKKVMKFI